MTPFIPENSPLSIDCETKSLGCEIAIKPKQSAKALYQAQIEKKRMRLLAE